MKHVESNKGNLTQGTRHDINMLKLSLWSMSAYSNGHVASTTSEWLTWLNPMNKDFSMTLLTLKKMSSGEFLLCLFKASIPMYLQGSKYELLNCYIRCLCSFSHRCLKSFLWFKIKVFMKLFIRFIQESCFNLGLLAYLMKVGWP